MSPGTITSIDRVAESAPAEQAGVVRESTPFGNFIGGGYGLFAGPTDDTFAGRYGGGFWPADRVQLPNNAPAWLLTEFQYRANLTWARWLVERNPLGKGFEKHVNAFVGRMTVNFVRRGQDAGATSSGPTDRDGDGEPDADPLVLAAQQFWDEWCEASDWGQGTQDREKESRKRLLRDGECAVRLGAGGPASDFLPWIRFVEPEQIRYPVGGQVRTPGDWQWGVCTARGDAERELAFWVAYPDSGGARGEEVPADQIVRMKADVDRSQKRGTPEFLPVEAHLQRTLAILANTGATGQEQSGVAWIEKYATATQEQVNAMIRQGAAAYPSPVQADAARVTSQFGVRTYGQTRVIHADSNRQWEPGPTSTGVPSYFQIVEATLKAVGFTWGVPDWFAGNGESTFAGALVTGSPFVKLTEERQDAQKGFTKSLAMRVVQLGEASGRLPPGTARAVRPVVTAMPVIIADEGKQATVTDMQLRNKLIDPQEAIKKRGGDPKVVIANWKVWDQHFPAAGSQPPAPPARANGPKPPAAGKDPEPAPPGSAGGDGSDPPDSLFVGESVREGGGPHSFASVMAPLTGQAAFEVLALGRQVRDEDLVGDGREAEPHVTVLYGLHTDDPADVLPVLNVAKPVPVRLGRVSVFPGADADVLKVEVASDDLVRLNAALARMPHTTKFPEYRPHATIAYVRPGRGEVYAARMRPVDLDAVCDRLVFSDRLNTQVSVPLRTGVAESAGLVVKDVTVHRGGKEFVQKRRVRAGGDDASPARASRPAETDHGKIDLSDVANSPEAKADPQFVAKVKEKAATAFKAAVALMSDPKAALYTLAYHTPHILGLWTDLFDGPDDLKKIGYNPSFSGTDMRQHSTLDPVKDATGMPAHMACGLMIKVGAAAISAVRKKLGVAESLPPGTDFARAGEFFHGLLAAMAEHFGLTPPPGADEIAAKLRELSDEGE
ncbi:hypothetical protein : Uncharacterized protein OS=Desulfotalea psychrophila (strain LSv54 / DSM 12343) GN=DP1991 PE=4 SV=1: Phage_portal_2: 2_5_RNA_ligase2 [Gemmataceae bacterium]|nr:hypothetical protein : Uncharacterized protein OS=Desulfotalea psychrophila (strain LSv54 / DSM 12343) GN=DP1991 PE=4 SV=1: Phage_portal_2: 2_5_RNA_ligase2 [Gemmataceae bacterium]VTT98930.1 hypothetical protein : Uncharacterized protein OS=Desulfotalea psychrophila (strain LSv54 / DSM 12343) GN=DP1991 PE=4 SV=1: Phage_portal_2: 2_5_RNA_ligase2 [Gemmataceae bacterium]